MGDVFLMDILDRAEIECPSPNYVSVERVTMQRETHTTIFAHPPADLLFPVINIAAGSHLEFGIGVKPTAWERIQSKIVFQIELNKPFGRTNMIFRETLDPANHIDQRELRLFVIDLEPFTGKDLRLRFRTFIPEGGDPAYAWSFWKNPRVTHAGVKSRRRRPTRIEELIFLITADALRADHLGCYGHPVITTPHIDRLAAEGWLFEHARTQSPATNAAYASLLTGRYPTEHGIVTEWGSLRYDDDSLPQVLARAGFRTMFAASEAELMDPSLGLVRRFQEQIPVVGNPMQDGAITLRRLLTRLQDRPPRRGFIWLQFFDTHPPSAVPEPFRSTYYEGDPTDPACVFHPEWIAEIRGMESMLDIRRALPRLEEGVADIAFGMRLRDSGAALQGEGISPPDLAPHIAALPPAARQGKSTTEFSHQLMVWGSQLMEGIIPSDLLAWLREILPLLEAIEAEILAWLEGVVDYNYALRQYWAQVSYLDHLIGELVTFLQAKGLYDRSTILLTSPHGELMGEQGMRFHHHTLQEGSLRVPLILKPGSSTRTAESFPNHRNRIKGVIDLIDIFPTLIEAAGAPGPAGLPGKSRLETIRLSQIPDHDSVSVGNLGLCAALTRGDHKLIWAFEDVWDGPEWNFQRGERRLIDLSIPDPDSRDVTLQEPELAQDIADRMDRWAQEHGKLDRR